MSAEGTSPSLIKFTSRADELSLELLNAVIRTRHPAVSIEAFEILERREYGEQMVSTSGRAILELQYASGAPKDLPARVVCKLALGAQSVMAAFYENEVQIYARVRPDLLVEAPHSLGALYDPESAQFVLMLEDLSERGARFPNVTQAIDLPSVEALLDTLATLHASHWESPRFATDLSWLQKNTFNRTEARAVRNGQSPRRG